MSDSLRLLYQIRNGVIVFPYQGDIENLMIELGIDRNGIGEKNIHVAPGVYVRYSDDLNCWTLYCDPFDYEKEKA